MWKHFISGYLGFTSKERTGIIVLVSLILFFIALPSFYPYFIQQKNYDHLDFEKSIALLNVKQADSSKQFVKRDYKNYDQYAGKNHNGLPSKGELFYFDPNTASTAVWQKLGVRDKTIATIQNYLKKGGKFEKREDIGKIWGLTPGAAERLMPYIQIDNSHPISYYRAEKQFERKEHTKAAYTVADVDINIGDTAAFIALPGIGSKLSQRIISFRDKLGGFYKVEQVGETFGLPDSTFQKIKGYLKINEVQPRRININTATADEMKSHPYLRYTLANAIVQYRTQHGNFASIADIKKIMLITEDVFNKLSPYLIVN